MTKLTILSMHIKTPIRDHIATHTYYKRTQNTRVLALSTLPLTRKGVADRQLEEREQWTRRKQSNQRGGDPYSEGFRGEEYLEPHSQHKGAPRRTAFRTPHRVGQIDHPHLSAANGNNNNNWCLPHSPQSTPLGSKSDRTHSSSPHPHTATDNIMRAATGTVDTETPRTYMDGGGGRSMCRSKRADDVTWIRRVQQQNVLFPTRRRGLACSTQQHAFITEGGWTLFFMHARTGTRLCLCVHNAMERAPFLSVGVKVLHAWACVHVNTCTRACVYVVYIYIYTCVCVCVQSCMHGCMREYMYECTWVCLFACALAHTCTNAYVCWCVRRRRCVHVHVCELVLMSARWHVCPFHCPVHTQLASLNVAVSPSKSRAGVKPYKALNPSPLAGEDIPLWSPGVSVSPLLHTTTMSTHVLHSDDRSQCVPVIYTYIGVMVLLFHRLHP